MAEKSKAKPEEPAEAAAEPAAMPADPTPEPAEDRGAALEKEIAELKDRLLRTVAEMDNLRKRTERELADARQYAVTSFAREVVLIGDNLHRALTAVPAEARAETPALASFVEGVEMTERELQRVLGKHGIRRLEPAGEKFDPHFHQAIFEVEVAGASPGTVVQTVQAGYAIGDRVLRPAMVSVARPPRAPTPQQQPESAAEADPTAASAAEAEAPPPAADKATGTGD